MSPNSAANPALRRALVTDATGPLGSWVVRMLLERGGFEVVAAVSIPRRDYLRAALDAEQVWMCAGFCASGRVRVCERVRVSVCVRACVRVCVCVCVCVGVGVCGGGGGGFWGGGGGKS